MSPFWISANSAKARTVTVFSQDVFIRWIFWLIISLLISLGLFVYRFRDQSSECWLVGSWWLVTGSKRRTRKTQHAIDMSRTKFLLAILVGWRNVYQHVVMCYEICDMHYCDIHIIAIYYSYPWSWVTLSDCVCVMYALSFSSQYSRSSCVSRSLSLSLSLSLSPKLAGVYWTKGWWRWWWQLEL